MTKKKAAGSLARRPKGDGSISRKHNSSCPPVSPDGSRPDHDCRGLWRARATIEDPRTGRKLTKDLYAPTQDEVLRKLHALRVEQATGQLVLDKMTVKAWLALWFEDNRATLKVNTRKSYQSKIDRYIVPAIGQHLLTKLTPSHVEKLYADMRARGLSESTCRQTHAILHRALSIAVRDGKVGRNVSDLIDAPSVETNRRAALSVGDAWKVLKLAGDDPRYWLALMTGLRQGEALALRWCDLYLDQDDDKHLVVRRAVSREPGVGLVYSTPKSRTSTDRVVPLVKPLAVRLEVARAKAFAAGAGPEDLVFTNSAGNAVDAGPDSRGWTSLLKAAGVPHTPLHGARNTVASLLEDCGTPPRVVAEILGHSNVAVTYGYQAGNAAARVEAMKRLEEHMDRKLRGGERKALGTGRKAEKKAAKKAAKKARKVAA